MTLYYHIKCCPLVFVISVILLNQCREVIGNNLKDDKEAYNQRDMLIEQFKIALMNDGDQLFALQKAFLFPRPSDFQSNGICLSVYVTVNGTITDYDPSGVCRAIDESNLTFMCTYTENFELLPPAAAPFTLADFLGSNIIVQVLVILDPSFYYLTTILSNGPIPSRDYHSYYYYDVRLSIAMNNSDLYIYRMQDDVTDALPALLSWVSYKTVRLGIDACNSYAIILPYTRTGKGLFHKWKQLSARKTR